MKIAKDNLFIILSILVLVLSCKTNLRPSIASIEGSLGFVDASNSKNNIYEIFPKEDLSEYECCIITYLEGLNNFMYREGYINHGYKNDIWTTYSYFNHERIKHRDEYFKDGLQDSIYTIFDKDGSILYRTYFHMGTGIEKDYHSNGQLYYEIAKKDGYFMDTLKLYNEEGILTEKLFYKRDSLIFYEKKDDLGEWQVQPQCILDKRNKKIGNSNNEKNSFVDLYFYVFMYLFVQDGALQTQKLLETYRGTGQLAYNRATKNINLKAKSQVFEQVNDYGSIANLEVDIGGYLIAREKKSKYDSSTGVSNEKPLSEFLADYLYNDPDEWTNRAKVFLQMLGGKLNAENKLENKEELKNKISTKLSNFGDLYVLNRINDKGKLKAEDLFQTSRHLEGAGNEVSEIFIDILETSITYPNRKLNSSIDPLPSEPGKAHNKYSILKKSEELYEKGKKYGEEAYKKIRRKIGL